MDTASLQQQSIEALARLERMAYERELGIVQRTVRDVNGALVDAWDLLFETREVMTAWQQRTQVDVGLGILQVKLRHAMGYIDEVLSEFEEYQPTRRTAT